MWSSGNDDSFNRTIELINYLIKQGKNIIVVGPTPVSAIGVPDRWIYQQLKEGRAIDTLTVPITNLQSLFDLQRLAQQQLFAPLASGRLIWLDPLQKLCDKTDCLLVNKGVIYIKDMTHLSEAGAMLFTEDFAGALGNRL
jgi:hypothetical protein